MSQRGFIIALIVTIFASFMPYIRVHGEATTCRKEVGERFDKIDKEWIESLQNLSRQRTPSSTLVQYAIRDYRTYMCKLDAVCEGVEKSSGLEGSETIKVNIIGCEEQELAPLEKCRDTDDPNKYRSWIDFCKGKVKQKKEEEREFMKVVLNRDAARKKAGYLFIRYETLLRRIHNELWEHMRMMYGFFNEFAHTMPCILKQCD